MCTFSASGPVATSAACSATGRSAEAVLQVTSVSSKPRPPPLPGSELEMSPEPYITSILGGRRLEAKAGPEVVAGSKPNDSASAGP